jgi:hypothetical protein
VAVAEEMEVENGGRGWPRREEREKKNDIY